jgi:hypothetical protein
MNYTYLPTSPYPLPSISSATITASLSGPVIILTVQPSSKKALNLLSNPRVSLLVHDWVSHRASFSSTTNPLSSHPNSDQPPVQQSSLAALLTNLNTASLSSISATLFGYAHLIPSGSEQEEFYRKIHTKNCAGAGESMCYIEDQDARIVVVRVSWARVADYKGLVKNWVASGEEDSWTKFDTQGQKELVTES